MTGKTSAVIAWFRRDLRINDHPALRAAIAAGGAVIPVYIHGPEGVGWVPGGASRWWLHHSLAALSADLERRGSRLVLRRGPAAERLADLAAETGASAVYTSRHCEPAAAARDAGIERRLQKEGLEVCTFPGALLAEPDEVRTAADTPYKVFTPFWRNLSDRLEVEAPLPAPSRLPAPARWPDSDPLDALGLLPRVNWAAGLAAAWQPGEAGAAKALTRFLDRHVQAYDRRRDFPGVPGTSRLSPHLHFGELSPRTAWAAVEDRVEEDAEPGVIRGGEAWLRQLAWREFAHHLLHHFPDTDRRPLRPEFEDFPWRDDPAALKAWQRGQTGYPVVDAGMRELWTTGWMHNRVRMIVASFLVKDLLVPWQRGAEWFWDTLVDADLANNSLGWQWTAGCGADAAPFFRVFNPTAQAGRYDSAGEYVRRWVPELSGLPDAHLNEPWRAPAEALRQAGVALEETYPRPIVDHGEARRRALDALQAIREE